MKFLTLILAVTLLVSTEKAFAWGDLGHETTAEIAEQLLKSEPGVLQNIHNILGVEPLAIASTWPDQARADERFLPFAAYHFLTVFEDANQHNEKDAMIVLTEYPKLLVSASVPREAKIIALRYLIHVLGDIHQPLHIGNEFDRGGNLCRVQWQPNPDRNPFLTNLHSVWDTSLVEGISYRIKDETKSTKYFGYKELAAALMERNKDSLKLPATVVVQSWIPESYAFLLDGSVYPDRLPAKNRPYCASNVATKDMPLLDKNYSERAMKVVEQRLVLGGVRTAAYLKYVFKSVKGKAPTEAQVLKILDITNK